MAKNTGARMPRADMSVLLDMRIPLPPLEQQRRIVGLLDRAAEIRRRADAARGKARAIIPALFLDMFGDPTTNPRGWPIEPLSELADIGSGLTKGRKLNGTPTVPTPYLRVANVQADRLDFSEIKLIDATEDDRQRCKLTNGDLLMTEGGDIDKLGRCAMWRGEVDHCLHQNHVFRVRMRQSVIPDYARAFMQSDLARSYFLRVAKRTTGIASINKTQLGQLPVWAPPLPLQPSLTPSTPPPPRPKPWPPPSPCRSSAEHLTRAEAMALELTPERGLLFRITHVTNLPWLLANGLHCANGTAADPNFVAIGNPDLIGRRAHRQVLIPPGGTLADYVPFYFTPKSPMLLNIKTGWNGIVRRPNQEIAILVSSCRAMSDNDVSMLFTDRHAYTQMATWSDNSADLARMVDWDILNRHDFARDDGYPDKMERYQAEALAHRHVPPSALLGIGCVSQAVRPTIEAKVHAAGRALSVLVCPGWYF
jgi:hypothetical protein